MWKGVQTPTLKIFGCLGLVVIINCPYRLRVRVNRFRCFLWLSSSCRKLGCSSHGTWNFQLQAGLTPYWQLVTLFYGLQTMPNQSFQWAIPTWRPKHCLFRFRKKIWVVVSNIFYFHPYLGKWSNLTNIFRMGWNHQLEDIYPKWPRPSILDDLEP